MKLPAELGALMTWIRIPSVSMSKAESPPRTERGASIVEWVIIVAVLAGLAITVGAIIISKVTAKANGINLGN